MKNSITTFICAMALSISFAFAANTDDKAVKNALPASAPVIETPAPQRAQQSGDYNKYTPEQKASLVGLKITKSPNK